MLAASTYPLEVVQADRWLKERKSLKGDALKKEVDKQSWDDSIKALASTAECQSAWGPGADRHAKLLIRLAVEGALLDAYSHSAAN